MRELKFRVWSDFWEKYADFEAELHMDGSVDADFEDDTGIPHHENTDLIIELCTGLKDKNGKEIYDGDIIHEKWYDSEAYRGQDRIGKVEYFCDGFFCCFRGEFTALGMFPPKHIEVIGNIHENPELLRDRGR